jgi:hypothetical protein
MVPKMSRNQEGSERIINLPPGSGFIIQDYGSAFVRKNYRSGTVLGIRVRNRIRNRIRIFFGLSDLDPLVRCTDPDPDPFL